MSRAMVEVQIMEILDREDTAVEERQASCHLGLLTPLLDPQIGRLELVRTIASWVRRENANR